MSESMKDFEFTLVNGVVRTVQGDSVELYQDGSVAYWRGLNKVTESNGDYLFVTMAAFNFTDVWCWIERPQGQPADPQG